MVDVVAEGFDAGIRQADIVPLDMVAVACSPPIRFVVVGAPAYFLEHAQPGHPNDLRRHRCIRSRLPGGSLYGWDFQRGDDVVFIDPSGPLTLDNYNLMIDAAVNGAGLSWVNEWSVRSHIAAGRLVTVLDDWSPTLPGLRLYYPGHRNMPAGMRAFLALVREVVTGEGTTPGNSGAIP
jgi:DNA-binding transcriptional LysR family regulator